MITIVRSAGYYGPPGATAVFGKVYADIAGCWYLREVPPNDAGLILSSKAPPTFTSHGRKKYRRSHSAHKTCYGEPYKTWQPIIEKVTRAICGSKIHVSKYASYIARS